MATYSEQRKAQISYQLLERNSIVYVLGVQRGIR